MRETLREEQIRLNKEHKCGYCGKKNPRGSRGKGYWHNKCREEYLMRSA